MLENYVFLALEGDNSFPVIADWRCRNTFSGADIIKASDIPWEGLVMKEIDNRVTRDTTVHVIELSDNSRLYYREGRRGPLCIVMNADTYKKAYAPIKEIADVNRTYPYITMFFPTINALDIRKGFSID